MQIPFIEIPNFADAEAAAQFDWSVFAQNPSWLAFLRRCSPRECESAIFESMCGPSRQMLKVVLRVGAPHFLADIYFVPLEVCPQDFCLALENWPAMKQFLREPSMDNATLLMIRSGAAKAASPTSKDAANHSQPNLETPLDKQAFQYDPNLGIPFINAPDFEDAKSAQAFDDMIISLNPRRKGHIRRSSRRELFPGQYEELCGPDDELFTVVVRSRPGRGCSGVVTLPKGTNLEEYASMTSKYYFGIDILANLTAREKTTKKSSSIVDR